MDIKFNKAQISALVTKQRVDDLCLLLPFIAKAVATYNKELKKQGVDKAARNACVVALSDKLFAAPLPESTDETGGDCYD